MSWGEPVEATQVPVSHSETSRVTERGEMIYISKTPEGNFLGGELDLCH